MELHKFVALVLQPEVHKVRYKGKDYYKTYVFVSLDSYDFIRVFGSLEFYIVL